MTINTMLKATPKYVLLDKVKQRFGPPVIESPAGWKCHSIYAFSDKAHFDLFCDECEIALTPYPLVQGYLRNQIENPRPSEANEDSAQVNTLNLVVLDPSGPSDVSLQAATMGEVLEAQANQMANVTVTNTLGLDPAAGVYRLDDEPV